MHIVGLYCIIDILSRVWRYRTVPAGCMELQYFTSLGVCNSEFCNVSSYVRNLLFNNFCGIYSVTQLVNKFLFFIHIPRKSAVVFRTPHHVVLC